MRQNLKKPVTLFLRGAGGAYSPKTLGGPSAVTDAILSRCFLRMRNWLHLARAVIHAEFPAFEAVASFSALKLSKNQPTIDAESVGNQLASLAHLTGVRRSDLKSQFDMHIRAALVHTNNGKDAAEAWRLTVAGRRGAGALQEALMRFVGYCLSTSGVEQLFAQIHGAVKPSRAGLEDASMRDEYDLVGNRPASDELDLVLELAPEIQLVSSTHRSCLLLIAIPLLIVVGG